MTIAAIALAFAAVVAVLGALIKAWEEATKPIEWSEE